MCDIHDDTVSVMILSQAPDEVMRPNQAAS